jgi:molybdopterin synthase sulfur carrier subunit
VKQKIGVSDEEINLPDEVNTVEQLAVWLCKRGPNYREALADLSVIRFAVNQEFANLNHPVTDNDEVAVFPPVTGG